MLRPLAKTGGRNSTGRITTSPGRWHKRQYRVIDFRRWDKDGVPAKVAHVSTTPTARLASPFFTTPTARSATFWPRRTCTGVTWWKNGPAADIKPGNNLPLKNIPVGTTIHDVETPSPGRRKDARSAGASVQLVARGKQCRSFHVCPRQKFVTSILPLPRI